MFEFLSSPFGLVAMSLGVLAVAILALCFWVTTVDRRIRGIADGLDAERRKVAELQMIVTKRAHAAASYGGRVPSQVARQQAQARQRSQAQQQVQACAQQVPGRPQQVPGRPQQQASQAAQQRCTPAQGAPQQQSHAPQRQRQANPQAGWTPESVPVPTASEINAWAQGSSQASGFDMPQRKMSRRARREAERAFAERAAAELEARRARRAKEEQAQANARAAASQVGFDTIVTDQSRRRVSSGQAVTCEVVEPVSSSVGLMTEEVIQIPASSASDRRSSSRARHGRHAR